jgi:hypothetical protein
MSLIHDEEYFSEKRIRERAEQYGFSDPLPVELFLWDCEIAAQLQNESSDFVLKGGAAAQLHLPVEMQRGSVDVDVVCPFTEEKIIEVLSRVHENLPKLEFEKYNPKRPKKEINMVTYLAKMPALVSLESGRSREVKIDFLLEDLELPSETIADVETFAVEVKKLKCYSVTSLLGDKLLTLAENTVGITRLADVPKQIYDVAVLSEEHKPTVKQFSEIVDVIEELAPLELRYRDLEIGISDVLDDVERTMERYGLLDTAGADDSLKRNVTNFQQFYVSTSQKWPWYEWSARALRILFLSNLVKATIEGQISVKEAWNMYDSAVQTSQAVMNVKGEEVKVLKRKLMDSADRKIPYFKNLKGKPLHRVFWQIVSRKNLFSIQDLVEV